MDPITGTFVGLGVLVILIGVVVWLTIQRERGR